MLLRTRAAVARHAQQSGTDHSGGEYLDELKIGGDRAHEIDASNGQDFTYRQNGHLYSSAGDLGRSRT
jgi:hypothetical protein